MRLFWPSLLWLLLCFVPMVLFTAGLYWLFTLPLRRQERSRFLLDLLEMGFRHGQSAEATIAAIYAIQDRSVGVRYHLLAAYTQNGLSFADALARVPSLASPQVAAMLSVGEKLGDPRKVFPVCRAMLKDASSQTRNAVNYFLLLALVGTPILPLTLGAGRDLVLPKLIEVADAYDVNLRHTTMAAMFHSAGWIATTQLVLCVLIGLGVAAYVGGPALRRWVATIWPAMCDWLMYYVPWRRKRLRRDFAGMLAMLLDAGVPEESSLQLAAASTANQIFTRHAAKAVQDLRAGMKLPAALRRFDADAELSWRLANASHEPSGFTAALAGWMEALDAKAFQQEQAFSQIFSTGLVLANGVIVGVIVFEVFHFIMSVTNEVSLW